MRLNGGLGMYACVCFWNFVFALGLFLGIVQITVIFMTCIFFLLNIHFIKFLFY